MDGKRIYRYLLPALLIPSLTVLVAAMVLALLAEPQHPNLSSTVAGALADSGADHSVTAVLLDFRAYDTLLEMAVLAAALAGAWSVGRVARTEVMTPSPVLVGLVRVLGPLFPVICGYLLWTGSTRPGGAFQAGSVLATMAVLLVLSAPERRGLLPELPMRMLAVAGPAVFLAVGLCVMAGGSNFLDYPPRLGKALVVIIETTATVSVAAILAGLFVGAPGPGGYDE